MLSEIYPGRSPKTGSTYWDQIQEVAMISVTWQVLERLHDLLDQVSFSTSQLNVTTGYVTFFSDISGLLCLNQLYMALCF